MTTLGLSLHPLEDVKEALKGPIIQVRLWLNQLYAKGILPEGHEGYLPNVDPTGMGSDEITCRVKLQTPETLYEYIQNAYLTTGNENLINGAGAQDTPEPEEEKVSSKAPPAEPEESKVKVARKTRAKKETPAPESEEPAGAVTAEPTPPRSTEGKKARDLGGLHAIREDVQHILDQLRAIDAGQALEEVLGQHLQDVLSAVTSGGTSSVNPSGEDLASIRKEIQAVSQLLDDLKTTMMGWAGAVAGLSAENSQIKAGISYLGTHILEDGDRLGEVMRMSLAELAKKGFWPGDSGPS